MLMQPATPELVRQWKAVYDQYRTQLSPNKKTADELIGYLQARYPLTESSDDALRRLVIDNVTQNEHLAAKLPDGVGAGGTLPAARVFIIQNSGAGAQLYAQQDDVFAGIEIFVGVELQTAYFMVEGSSLLWDELLAFRGLDAEDLNNFYLVAEYVGCLRRFGRL